MSNLIDFQVDPTSYRHWRVTYEGEVANLYMDVDEDGGLFDGYQLKLNSYDLGVDIELADVVQRMRFEHPEIKAVILQSGKDRVFCAGANIKMLGNAAHAHKVNFCKFTNETRNTFEAAGAESGQHYIAAINGTCAGGGYELALACDYIMLTDDGSAAVALPEVPLLAVLPGTGGLTRLTDKRKIRRDRADVFCSLVEGIKGARAKSWNLVDEVITNSKFAETVEQRAGEFAANSTRAASDAGIELNPLYRSFEENGDVKYSSVNVTVDRTGRSATISIEGPDSAVPVSLTDLVEQGSDTWMLRCARELDDALLHLRLNELELGNLIFTTRGDATAVLAHESFLMTHKDHWLAHEILLYWKRVLKRIDMTSRSLIALIEPGSCFAGVLAEILFAVDRTYMAEGEFEDNDHGEATITLGQSNFGLYPMANNLTRLQTRFLSDDGLVEAVQNHIGQPLNSDKSDELELVTYCFDDIDWEDEIRIFLEERSNFSPDALTGMEANLRFAGPETMETRIFGRLTAWQNWIFQRPNAVGETGALQRYGTGVRGEYDKKRV
ncbi:MAG: 2,3-epoxybenzoyl-CoA dihydrolase [Sneathiella sp.]|nr:2,3-epoxybenzoyl-CoA dihydrolase [Sneathiella sp.]